MSRSETEDEQRVIDVFTFNESMGSAQAVVGDAGISRGGLHLILGGPGEDDVLGTDRADLMLGKGGSDHLAAGPGADRMLGGKGGDVLDGGPGNDKIVGGHGGDYLIGNFGVDTMSGGGGYNQFAFNEKQDSGPGGATRDTITDFSRGQDHLTFTQLPLDGGRGGYSFIGRHEFDHAGEVRYEAAKDGGINVFVNMDGDRHAELGIHLNGVSALSSADFYF